MSARLTPRAFAALLGLAANASFGRTFPENVVKIIVPTGPRASATSPAARSPRAVGLVEAPGVENRPGGAGVIGTGSVAAAAADGHTLLVSTVAETTVTPHLLPKLHRAWCRWPCSPTRR